MDMRKGAYRVLVVRPEGKSPVGRPGIDGRILNLVVKKWDGEALTGLI
jgi:hypothetical protein